MTKTRLTLTGMAFVFVTVCSTSAAEWGSLKGRFVVDGTAAKPKPVSITKDPEYCGKHNLVDETAVVGKDNALANAIVYLKVGLGKKIEIHPDYETTLKQPVV